MDGHASRVDVDRIYLQFLYLRLMLYRLLRGKMSWGAFLLVVGVKFCVRNIMMERERSERMDQALAAEMPALHLMKPSTLEEADWDYSGPLGAFNLHFQPDGGVQLIDPQRHRCQRNLGDQRYCAAADSARQ